MSRSILPCGDLAFLVELPSLDDVMALHQALSTDPPPGLAECVAGAQTVLVQAISPVAAMTIAQHVRSLSLTDDVYRDAEEITIDVVYDGEDLDTVAALLAMSREAVIEAHTAQGWTAAFGGFAPGFTYCIGENDSLTVARRESPRTTVPAGSVALAGHFSAVYPRATPGGWQLIGRTAQEMWSPAKDKPAYVAPGNIVHYRAVSELIAVTRAPAESPPQVDYGFEICATGPQSLFQDQGRPGHAHLGVPVSGAMDLRSARRANIVVGNPTGTPVIESLMGGLEIRAIGDLVLGVTGADAPLEVTGPGLAENVNAYHPPNNTPFALLDGQTIAIGPPTLALHSYVAIRGGIDVPRVLDSASTDLLSGEGPDPLAAGQRVAVIEPKFPHIVADTQDAPDLPGDVENATVILGPRDGGFDSEQIDSLFAQEWTVTDRSSRVGLRLGGTALKHKDRGELPSEGAVPGAIQVPHDGNPVLLMRDHPVTGGYPVIGVVNHHDLDRLAQLSPGSKIRFRLYQPPSTAEGAIDAHERDDEESEQ